MIVLDVELRIRDAGKRAILRPIEAVDGVTPTPRRVARENDWNDLLAPAREELDLVLNREGGGDSLSRRDENEALRVSQCSLTDPLPVVSHRELGPVEEDFIVSISQRWARATAYAPPLDQ